MHGEFKGVRATESFADYGMWVTYDDLNTYQITLYKQSLTKYPEGTVGGTLVGSIPALEDSRTLVDSRNARV